MSKLESLTFFTNGMTEEQREVWGESVKAASPVTKRLVLWLRREIDKVHGEMRLDVVTKSPSPGQAMLALQAKKEAYESLLAMLDN